MHTIESAQPSAFDVLLAKIDSILGEWRSLVNGEPWTELSPSDLVDAFPEILPRLFRLARQGQMEIDEELREQVARAHGERRRDCALPLRSLADEWNHVRRACWIVLRRSEVPEAEVVDALSKLDHLIDDAIGYTLRGYYTPELDRLRGRGLERRAGREDRRSGTGDRRDD